MFEYRISNLTFSGGEITDLKETGLLIIVGANNSGKSKSLRDIYGMIGRGFTERFVGTAVKSLNIIQDGSYEEFLDWLGTKSHVSENQGERQYNWAESEGMRESQIQHWFKGSNNNTPLYQFGTALTYLDEAEHRLRHSNPVERIDVRSSPLRNPIHHLQKKVSLAKEIAYEFRKGFGKDLIVDEFAGTDVYFRVGSNKEEIVDNPLNYAEYVQEHRNHLQQWPKLHEEGDGMRSFVASLLTAKTQLYKIILIDEPELFLHPPQARRLGSLLAESTQDGNLQIIVATHSSDFIQGAINASDKVTICRINRIENKNHAYALGGEELKGLLDKPILKTAKVINGLFYTGVVVCEGDHDQRFYESITLLLDKHHSLTEPVELHFVNGGGKQELPYLISAYKSLHVPVVAIADFDILRDSRELQRTVEALGGDWNQIEKTYHSISNALNQLSPISPINEVVNSILELAEEFKDKGRVSRNQKNKLFNLLENSSDWSDPKKHGITILRGGLLTDCKSLLSTLEMIGLYVVPGGELESWGPELSASSKAKWIHQALQEMDNEKAFPEATDFMLNIAKRFSQND